MSIKITELLISNSVINKSDKDLYNYGFFMLISKILYFILTLIIGIAFNLILESIVFYIAFQFIRQYAGGYHAATEVRCNVMTSLSLICSISIIYLSKQYDIKTELLVLSILTGIIIFILCPLDTPEKPLSKKEFKHFRKTTWIILFVLSVLIITSYIFNIHTIFAPCCISLILESILLTAGKLKR